MVGAPAQIWVGLAAAVTVINVVVSTVTVSEEGQPYELTPVTVYTVFITGCATTAPAVVELNPVAGDQV